MNNCTHTIQKEEYITEDYFGEPIDGYWKYWEESACADVDLHRYKCTKCNKMMYYSGAARKYYEEGIDNDVLWNK